MVQTAMQHRRVLRQARFWLLEHVMLPLAVPPLRVWMRTWRRSGPQAAALQELRHASPAVLITCHGMLLQVLRFADVVRPRRIVVMLSPSLDGRLLAAMLLRFGIDHVFATDSSHAVGGTLRFIERLHSGDLGVIAGDGPRGPCGVMKPGAVRIAAAAGARIALVVTTARPAVQLGSWDRAQLPLPSARIELSLQMLPAPPAHAPEAAVAELNQALWATGQRLRSTVLRERFAER